MCPILERSRMSQVLSIFAVSRSSLKSEGEPIPRYAEPGLEIVGIDVFCRGARLRSRIQRFRCGREDTLTPSRERIDEASHISQRNRGRPAMTSLGSRHNTTSPAAPSPALCAAR